MNELEDDFLEYFELFEVDDNAHGKARALLAKKHKISLVTAQRLLDHLGYFDDGDI